MKTARHTSGTKGRGARSRPLVPGAAAAIMLLVAVPVTGGAQASFSATIAPNPVTLQAGGGAVGVTVTTTMADAMREPILYSFSGFPAGIDTGGSRSVGPPHDPETFPFTAAGSVPPGTYSGILTGSSSAGSVTVPMTVVVQAAPVIEAILPPALGAGTRENVLRITGQNFQPGAIVTASHPGVQVLGARVLTSSTAEVLVSVRPDTPPGAYGLDLRNPDGSIARGATLAVHPSRSLSGPLAVTGVHIVLPRSGQIVAEGEVIRPRAILATSGAGTIVGTWRLDGVPFERFTRIASGGQPVEVRATMPIPVSYTGEHRLELVLENPATLPPQGVSFLQAAERRSGLRVLVPEENGTLDPSSPLFRWSLVPGASGYEIEMRYRVPGGEEASAWTVVRRRTNQARWWPEPTLVRGLQDAEKEFRVRAAFPGEVFGEPTEWRAFRFQGEAEEDGSGDRAEARPGLGGAGAPAWGGTGALQEFPVARGSQVDLLLGLTTTANSSDVPGPSALTRLQISTSSDIQGGLVDQHLVGDVSASHDLDDPWRSRADSRSWLARFSAAEGAVRPEATIGFAPPNFLDGSELLGVFTSGGGLQGTVHSPVGRVSYYRSARLGATQDPLGPDPGIQAAGYEAASEDGRYLVRATTLRVRDRPIEGFSPGGRGEAWGLMAGAELSPRLQLQGEAAMAEFRPGEDSFEEERDGTAFRLSARGAAGTLGYSLAVGRTGAGFVNPANPGFTPAGTGNRTRAELSLNTTFFQRAFVNGTYNHVRSGSRDSLGEPRTTENGVLLNVSVPATSRIFVNVSGNVSGQQGDGIEEFGFPGADRTQKGFNVSVTESLGRISLSQSVGRQILSDTGQPWAGQQITDGQVGAFGSLHPLVDLSATVSGSRIRGAAEVGTTRSLLFSVQPSVAVGDTGLRLTPRAAFSRARNDGPGSDFRSTQLHASARWTGPWETVNLDVELSSDFLRNWNETEEERPSFDNQIRFSVGLSWQTGRAW